MSFPCTLTFKPRALKDLESLPRDDAARILDRLRAYAASDAGDVKRLTNHEPGHRLRAGDWRVLFDLDERRLLVYRVLHRREAYR